MDATDVLIIGAGVFGLTAAVTLRERGLSVAVLDPGPIAHPLAASTDLNKAVRMEYGKDALYMQMVDRSIDGWLAWNQRFGERVYEPSGVLMLAGAAMTPGGFEHDSYQLALREGHAPERLPAADIVGRFPAWAAGRYPEAFFHARGGYCRSGLTVSALAREAERLGVVLYRGHTATKLIESAGRVTGVQTRAGQVHHAEHTILAAGAWSAALLPGLTRYLRATAHPLFYLVPPQTSAADDYRPPRFPVFCADVANTGWYGFPIDPATGLIKVALHDAGHGVEPDTDRDGVAGRRLGQLRAFLSQSLPGLKDATLHAAKHCFYTDTLDGHFWIDRHPTKAGLTVATGGSGHAMKFAPVLGPMIADVVMGKPNGWLGRFSWRASASAVPGDAARAR